MDEYIKLKNEIDSLIVRIHNNVLKCNPLELLKFSQGMFQLANWGITSEVQVTGEAINISRSTEYIQSILVASPAIKSKQIAPYEEEKLMHLVLADIEHLFELINAFYIAWGQRLSVKNKDDDLVSLIIEEQLDYSVRGNRYQVWEAKYYESLLAPHNDEIIKLFGFSTDELITGFKKIEHALSQGKFDAANSLGQLVSQVGNADVDNYLLQHSDECEDIICKLFGEKLNDVEIITGWPRTFIKELAYGLGENTLFFNREEFSGWPIIDLPIQQRPFIEIEERYYCFDYYSFVDNFYRVMQKLIQRFDPEYPWKDVQATTSERVVGNLFKKLLPDCEVFYNNYYPIDCSIKQMAENDILIKYENILFVVEVKAGSFVYTSPMLDFEAHIKSYHNLITKADHQCNRVNKYIERTADIIFYNQDASEKFRIKKSIVKDVYQISVTVDNINAIAARAEKISFLQLESNTISISLDDLIVYSEYFDSPMVFLHFLCQRRRSTLVKALTFNDELDHLGMYIEKNCYTFEMEKATDADKYFFVGFREKLDSYFGQLYHSHLTPSKPVQNMPELLRQIIGFLDISSINNKVQLASYLLDFSEDARKQFCNNIEYILKRQLEINASIPMFSAGRDSEDEHSLRYTCFIQQPGVKSDVDYMEDYTLSTMIWNQETDRVLIIISFDDNAAVTGVLGYKYYAKNILETDRTRLNELGAQNAIKRVEWYKLTHPGKIGRNELCPCGSGRKYKRCCGK